MKAVCWHGKYDMRVDNIPDPQILNPSDAIIKITSTAICGSDLHMYDGYIPTMEAGDVVGHEFMGEVVEVGPEVKKTKVGDRVIIPFTIACGHCWFCEHDFWSCCDNSNPNGTLAEELYGATPSALFGYSHLYGGYAGGQAEYARVPFADVGPFKIPSDLSDEKVLFLTDIMPTGWQGAVYCNIQPGDTVAVWGCGPVGQFAIQSAYLLGAGRVIAIDEVPERLQMAREWSKAETIDYSKTDVLEALAEMTGGRGPDSCLDAVGMEAHGVTVGNIIDRVKAAAYLATDRPNVLRQAIMACRKGGHVSVPGVYGGMLDKIPFGAAFAKGLTFKMGQTHVHKYLPELLQRIQKGDFDRPDHLISHRLTLDQAPHGYDIFGSKKENCTKIVMHPHG